VDVFSDLKLGKGLSGVLGLDAMQRADRVTITFPRPRSGGEISFGPASESSTPADAELPFSLVGNHIFVRGHVNGQPITFLVDSGSRETYVAPWFAAKAGIKLEPGSIRAAGLDGTIIETRSGTADQLKLGNRTFPDARLRIADIPVLANFGLQKTGAILGNDFLQRLAKLEIDFVHRTLRLFVQRN